MDLVAFSVAFVGAAGALALWVDTRFPDIRPHDMRGALIHLAVAFLVSCVASGLLGDMLVSSGVPGGRLCASIGIVLPGLAYVCLAVLWLVRSIQGALRGSLP
jgi:hypothetical protein